MSDIIFIKDENDYLEYKKLKPVRQYIYKKVKFICTCCKKEKIQSFKRLTKELICGNCKSRIAHNSIEYKEKIKQTFLAKYGVDHPSKAEQIKNKKKETYLNHYGVENPFKSKEILEKREQTYIKHYGVKNPVQSKEIQEKIKNTCIAKYNVPHPLQSNEIIKKVEETCINRYGVKNPFQSEEIKDKIKQTLKEHYGVEHAIQSDEVKDKIKQTLKERYGVEYASQSDEVKDKIKQTVKERYGVEYVSQSDEVKDKIKQTVKERYGVEYATQAEEIKDKIKESKRKNEEIKLKEKFPNLITYNTDTITLFCNDCNTKYTIAKSLFFNRLAWNIKLCTNCLPYKPCFSTGEKDVVKYIKTIYNGIILENDRKVLNGKEIDIYLPELAIAFEFDGTYWHADDRFYDKTDIIAKNTAQEIWNNDNEKILLCKSKGISLIRIKEYDWYTNNENEKLKISKIINKSINEEIND